MKAVDEFLNGCSFEIQEQIYDGGIEIPIKVVSVDLLKKFLDKYVMLPKHAKCLHCKNFHKTDESTLTLGKCEKKTIKYGVTTIGWNVKIVSSTDDACKQFEMKG